jgi:hypothetical protein
MFEDSYNDAEFDDPITMSVTVTSTEGNTISTTKRKNWEENSIANLPPLNQNNINSYSLATNADYKGITYDLIEDFVLD